MSHVRLLPKVTYISSLPFPSFHFLLSSLQVNRRTGAVKRVGVLDINMSEFVSAGNKAALCLLQVLELLFFCLALPSSILLPLLLPPVSLPLSPHSFNIYSVSLIDCPRFEKIASPVDFGMASTRSTLSPSAFANPSPSLSPSHYIFTSLRF